MVIDYRSLTLLGYWNSCTVLPLGIIAVGLSFAATLGTVERTAFGTFDQISDAGLAVVVKTRQDFRLLEVVRAYWARELVVQFLETGRQRIYTSFSHLGWGRYWRATPDWEWAGLADSI